ncbi:MAG TPA: response regulator transcription factor [Thermomicrobiales bacterium]|jgi:DNA-binding NarL/FixJ family response regulator|nr:response regulator transcription factor [Thermomicrobiales bacterium]
MIRILVVDDHPVVREGLVMMLGTQPDMEVVGEAGDGLAAVQRAAELTPDVVLMDLEMPGLDGPEAIQRIHAANPDARILVLTAYDTDERILQAVQAGARGYLLKGVPRDEIFQAVRVVDSGGSLLQPAVATKLLNRVGDLLRDERTAETLTERELQVLELMAKGYRNKEIARELFITERTVKFHANIIFQKLNVDSRTEAVSEALRRGIIKL